MRAILKLVEIVYDAKLGKHLKVNIAGIMARCFIGGEEQMRGFVDMALDDCRRPAGRLLKSISSDFGVAFAALSSSRSLNCSLLLGSIVLDAMKTLDFCCCVNLPTSDN